MGRLDDVFGEIESIGRKTGTHELKRIFRSLPLVQRLTTLPIGAAARAGAKIELAVHHLLNSRPFKDIALIV